MTETGPGLIHVLCLLGSCVCRTRVAFSRSTLEGIGRESRERRECLHGGKDDVSHLILRRNGKRHHLLVAFRVSAAGHAWVRTRHFSHVAWAAVWGLGWLRDHFSAAVLP